MRTMWKRALRRKREADARRGGVRQAPQQTGNPAVDPEHERKLEAWERPQGVPDPRAKSSGHGQKTADKWNQ